jgi:Uma2 family endonuclease
MSMMRLPGHFPTSVVGGPLPTSPIGDPPWEIATLFPAQGTWTVDAYLELTDSTNHLVEFTDGRIEVLPMPTVTHQRILAYLFTLMQKFVQDRQLGEVLFAGLRVQLDSTKFREPDIVFLRKGRQANVENRYWDAADLVVEIVSDDPGSRDRDLVTKRGDYAAAGIDEYWIVDPATQQISVLVLNEASYETAGVYSPGDEAISRVLDGFTADVASVFRAANG